MNNCNHYWERRGTSDIWDCERCKVLVRVPDDDLQLFIYRCFLLSKMLEMEPIQLGEEKEIYSSPMNPLPSSGKNWFNTNTGKLMKWDGKEWVEV